MRVITWRLWSHWAAIAFGLTGLSRNMRQFFTFGWWSRSIWSAHLQLTALWSLWRRTQATHTVRGAA